MKEIVKEIKRKKEFSMLPNSIVKRVAKLTNGDVKESRALLRKYFGVFLTNKVLKGKGSFEDILKAHISSKKRDYGEFYNEIFSNLGEVNSVIDFGCGVNGFSYTYLRNIAGEIDYIGVEASGQLVKQMNSYFKEKGFRAKSICIDLFNIEEVLNILKEAKKPRVVFMFQVIDALENLEKNFSKEFLLKVSKKCEKIVLSLPLVSLSGKKTFKVQRKWLKEFLEENFKIEKDFKLNGERILIINTSK